MSDVRAMGGVVFNGPQAVRNASDNVPVLSWAPHTVPAPLHTTSDLWPTHMQPLLSRAQPANGPCR